VNQELPTVRRAAKIAALLRQRHGKDKVAAVVCRYDSRAEIGQEDIERAVGLPVWGVIPSDYRLTIAAANDGRPFVLDKGRLPTAVREFAARLRGQEREKPASPHAAKRVASRIAGLF
jgi:septum formation inhibitor-activating ATPase MinD